MEQRSTRRGRVAFGALAAAGVAGAHWLAFRLVAPDAHVRGELLEHTGHRYFNLVAALAFGVFAGTAASVLAGRIKTPATMLRCSRLTSLVRRLALVQAVGWLALEGAERLFAAHAHGSMFQEPVVWIGLALQLVVAACGVLLFAGADRAIAVLLAARRPSSGSRSAVGGWGGEVWWVPVSEGRRDAWSSRAPPLCSSN